MHRDNKGTVTEPKVRALLVSPKLSGDFTAWQGWAEQIHNTQTITPAPAR